MSRMGQHVMEMQEDAVNLSEDAFFKKYGKENADLREQFLSEYYGEGTDEPIVPVLLKEDQDIPF